MRQQLLALLSRNLAQIDRGGGRCYWLHSLNVLNLDLPSVHRLERFLVVACDADHEAVSSPVLNFTVDAKMLITAGIVDLDLDLVLLDGFDAPIYIQYRRFVVLRERIVKVVRDETRFTNRRVSDQH